MADTPIKQSSYPYLFDSTEIPFPAQWEESFNRVVAGQQSEAGDDIETIIRRGKLSVSVQCNGMSSLKTTIQTFSDKDYFVLSRYDDVIGDYQTYTVRMTKFSANRVYRAEEVEGTVGLWNISFTLEEF